MTGVFISQVLQTSNEKSSRWTRGKSLSRAWMYYFEIFIRLCSFASSDQDIHLSREDAVFREKRPRSNDK